MNPYLSAILTIAGLVLLFVLWIFYENRKIKNNTLERIRRNWGKPSKRQYEAGDLEQISHYFRRKEKDVYPQRIYLCRYTPDFYGIMPASGIP